VHARGTAGRRAQLVEQLLHHHQREPGLGQGEGSQACEVDERRDDPHAEDREPDPHQHHPPGAFGAERTDGAHARVVEIAVPREEERFGAEEPHLGGGTRGGEDVPEVPAPAIGHRQRAVLLIQQAGVLQHGPAEGERAHERRGEEPRVDGEEHGGDGSDAERRAHGGDDAVHQRPRAVDKGRGGPLVAVVEGGVFELLDVHAHHHADDLLLEVAADQFHQHGLPFPDGGGSRGDDGGGCQAEQGGDERQQPRHLAGLGEQREHLLAEEQLEGERGCREHLEEHRNGDFPARSGPDDPPGGGRRAGETPCPGDDGHAPPLELCWWDAIPTLTP